MTPLRQKMINDMKLRRFALGTQKLYVYAVKDLARYYHRSPDLISEEEAHYYLLYLQEERKLDWGSCNCMAAGLNFFYKTTLQYDNIRFKIPKRKQARKLPTIFSRPDLKKLFEAADTLKNRVENTATRTGLKVKAHIIKKIYQTGRKYADNFKETMKIIFDDYFWRAVCRSSQFYQFFIFLKFYFSLKLDIMVAS